jgi:hypothetical protein
VTGISELFKFLNRQTDGFVGLKKKTDIDIGFGRFLKPMETLLIIVIIVILSLLFFINNFFIAIKTQAKM